MALPIFRLGLPTAMLWNNPSGYCEYFLLTLVNKDADWPIARQDEVGQDNQTEDTEMKRGGVKGVSRRCREKQDEHAILRKGTNSWQNLDSKYRLI